MAHRKQTMTLTIAIYSAAQYNDKGEWLYVSLQTWIYVPLQTDKWVWLYICLQKVSGRGSQRSYYKLLHINIYQINSFFCT